MSKRIPRAIIPRLDTVTRFTEYRYCANIRCMAQQEHSGNTCDELDAEFRADGWREYLPGQYFCPAHARRQ